MPVAVLWNLVAAQETRGAASAPATTLANTVHMWAGCRQAKTIHEIELRLAQCLAHSPRSAETPTAVLRLPSLCPMLAVPREDRRINYLAVSYDLLAGAEASGSLELRLSLFTVNDDRWVPISLLHLTGPTLSE